MASLYKRRRSPFWWVKYRDESGQVKQVSSGYRYGIPSETRKAQLEKNRRSIAELNTNKLSAVELWGNWVPEFLESRYAKSPLTYKRYENAWRNLDVYLQQMGISRPRQLNFRHCEEYMRWRPPGYVELGVYPCSHNTARWELKILHRLMNYAIQRGFSVTNPCASLGIPKHKPKEKPELSDGDINEIRENLVKLKMAEWMRVSFEIAIHQGCRLRETAIPLSKVDIEKMTIGFHAKGGRDFTAPMHPKLLPMFQQMKRAKQKVTCELPAMPSKHWFLFFKKIGLHKKGVSFHCTRVTVITRLIRAGEPENKVRKIVNHSSTEVNRIYQRLGVDDVRKSLAGLVV